MKVLITGGGGFIGGHAVKHFVDCGDLVLNVDKITYAADINRLKASNFLQLDVADRESFENVLKDYNPDCVIHFAAETHVDNSIKSYEDFVKSNVQGTASVAMACSNLGIKLCHISTDEVYGPAGNRPFDEDDRLNPMNPYSATKAAGDMLVKSFHNTYKLQYLLIRPSNNYGPGQHEEKFIPKLLKSIRDNKKFPLYGDGSQVREWTYVKDTVAVIKKLISIEKNWSSTYNLTSGISMTNVQAIEKILEAYNEIKGTQLKIQDVIETVDDRKGHDKKYFISQDKLKSVVNHRYTNFDFGVMEIINGQ